MTLIKRIVSAVRGVRAAKRTERFFYALAALWLLGSFATGGYALVRLPLTGFELVGVIIGTILVAAVGLSLFATLAELCGQRARDIAAQGIFDALRAGEQAAPYALYLRPFAATDVFGEMRAGALLPGAAHAAMSGFSSERLELEAQIERAVRPLGRLVALGAPLEHLGAGRIRVDDAAWQEAIALLMRHAELIVMLPSSRQGTLHEINVILGSDFIQRTVLIDPPNLARKRGYDHAVEWEKVQEAFRAHAFELPEESPAGRLLFYGAEKAPTLQEKLDIDAEDRIERLFRRVIRFRRREDAAQGAES